nr:hypothetical protein [Pseudofrankia asymbiotica]
MADPRCSGELPADERGLCRFDVDLQELQGQDRLDDLCELLRMLGRLLGKPVVMTAEGSYQDRLLGYNVEADRVVLLTDPTVGLPPWAVGGPRA